MYPYTNTCSGSTEKLDISTEATTIPASPFTFLAQYGLDTKLK